VQPLDPDGRRLGPDPARQLDGGKRHPGLQGQLHQDLVAAVVVLLLLSASVRIVPEYERGVIFRLGRVIDAGGRGSTVRLRGTQE
jgi:hypothetical protein